MTVLSSCRDTSFFGDRAEMTRSCLRCMGFAGAMLLAAATLSASPAAAESRPVQTLLAQLPPSQPAAPPIVNGVPFLIRFAGTVRGIAPGAAVEVQGIRIGAVQSVGLEYASDSNSFIVIVVIEL